MISPLTLPLLAPEPAPVLRCVIVVPCLDERAHIGALLEELAVVAREIDASIVVVDGGSRDGTYEIARCRAEQDKRIRFLLNPRRIQSAAINLAVERFGDGADVIIRIDAHGDYPPGYCRVLLQEAIATGADSVVVGMRTVGRGVFQRAAAAAQNSALGTGGSRHRLEAPGGWIEHGHHALMRITAFRSVGGYDETFTHNEDAELDHRLGLAGRRIWMTGLTRMTYYPRATPLALFRQYLLYGQGRARNVLKHRMLPRLRQALPLAVAPAVFLSGFAFLHWSMALPFLFWAAACLGIGAVGAVRGRNPAALLSGFAAMVMHFGWSLGFWTQLFRSGGRRKAQI